MKPESEVRQRLQMWTNKHGELEFGKPDEIKEAEISARIKELEWVLAD